MILPFFEKKFKNWLSVNNIEYKNLNYKRSQFNETSNAYYFKPASKIKAGIIFAHGIGNDSLYPQAHIFKTLLKNGYAIFTFDMDGHGKNSTTPLKYPEITGSIADAVYQAQLLFNDDIPVHIVGYSLGAYLALHYVAHNKEQEFIKSVIAISSPINVKFYILQLILQSLKELTAPFRSAFYDQYNTYGPWNLIPPLGKLKNEYFPIRKEDKSLMSRNIQYMIKITNLINSIKLVDVLDKINLPVLLIYGDNDGVVSKNHGITIYEKVPSSILHILKSNTHFTTIMSKEAQKHILNWLHMYPTVVYSDYK